MSRLHIRHRHLFPQVLLALQAIQDARGPVAAYEGDIPTRRNGICSMVKTHVVGAPSEPADFGHNRERYLEASEQWRKVRWEAQDILDDLFPHWPNYSGNSAYPVPHPEYVNTKGTRGQDAAGSLYDRTQDQWVGTYGAYRMDLVNWLIETLELQLELDRRAS